LNVIVTNKDDLILCLHISDKKKLYTTFKVASIQSPFSSINKIFIPFFDVTPNIATYFYYLSADVTSDKT